MVGSGVAREGEGESLLLRVAAWFHLCRLRPRAVCIILHARHSELDCRINFQPLRVEFYTPMAVQATSESLECT